LDEAALAMLVACDWPGNVRQLENLCRRLTVMAPGRIITTTDLPTEVRGQGAAVAGTVANDWQQLLVQAVTTRLERGQHDILAEVGPQFERTLLRTALSFTGGRKQEAARWLGWGRNTLTRKLKELGID
jgi:two-component system nitrogen regulation response regulator GlnG